MAVENASSLYDIYSFGRWTKELFSLSNDTTIELIVRAVILLAALLIYNMKPFERIIPSEEWWRYKNPFIPNIRISKMMFVFVLILPLLVIIYYYVQDGNEKDLRHSWLALSLAISLNSLFTSVIKVMVGRPRPNFFYTCYPDGVKKMKCTGDPKKIDDGRKSFPSGHASYAFTFMTFVTLYLAGKLDVFNMKGRGQSWRICTCIFPSLIAIAMSINRTCNYRHHWEDIVVGAIIGMTLGYICYRQHFPSVFDYTPGVPYRFLK